MIPTIVAVAVGALGTLPAPNTQLEQSERHGIGIEVVLEVEADRFTAENHGANDYLLVFGDADHGALTHVVLRSGATLAYEFGAGLLDGLFLEVLSVERGRWVASGALPLGELTRTDHGSVWLQRTPRVLDAWIERGEGFDHWTSLGPLAPQSPGGSVRGQAAHRESLHVPVVDPSDEPEEEKPPVLEPKPLPPV